MAKRTATAATGNRPLPSFYDRVYEFVRKVPRGQVITYGHIALCLGAPMAARAVGYALAALPAGNDVPWWRVINAQGAIPQKNRGSSADLQRALLEHEGVTFNAAGRADLAVFRWWPDGLCVAAKAAGRTSPETLSTRVVYGTSLMEQKLA
jgi:methylated-DNA-protein-cysteine methyltransferase-like protein